MDDEAWHCDTFDTHVPVSSTDWAASNSNIILRYKFIGRPPASPRSSTLRREVSSSLLHTHNLLLHNSHIRTRRRQRRAPRPRRHLRHGKMFLPLALDGSGNAIFDGIGADPVLGSEDLGGPEVDVDDDADEEGELRAAGWVFSSGARM